MQVTGMVVQIVTLRMVMVKTGAMIGMGAHEVAAIGMEVEGQQGLREEITRTGQGPMIALTGQDAHLPLIATRCFVVMPV